MLFFFIFVTCFSLIFLYNSLYLKPLPHWAYETRLISFSFLKHFSLFSIKTSLLTSFTSIPTKMSLINSKIVKNVVDDHDQDQYNDVCLLDLPDLVLECILERLTPKGLVEMCSVCSSMREKCMSDHLWEKHMKQKWGKIIGVGAYREWQWHVINSRKELLNVFDDEGEENGLMKYLVNNFLPLGSNFSGTSSVMKRKRNNNKNIVPPIDSIMSWYLALESGKFWFPAQVYNRENGHVGFILSCYDAEICYDPKTDTFQARYPPHGRRAVAVETCVTWDRIRAPPVDTSAHDLHKSDCLSALRPGDHIEIQWRRNKEFPYGWWYGIVGHLETCDGNQLYCRCHQSETAVLEFNQYARGSRWRRTNINRKDHREEGNEADGFYGGIRKLHSNEEISVWKHLWPADVLE